MRYVHTTLGKALKDAVDGGMLALNPAAKAHPPPAKQAKSPEMHLWSKTQLDAFLSWAREVPEGCTAPRSQAHPM